MYNGPYIIAIGKGFFSFNNMVYGVAALQLRNWPFVFCLITVVVAESLHLPIPPSDVTSVIST